MLNIFLGVNIMGLIKETGEQVQNCIDMCTDCEQACIECMKMCLEEEDVKERKGCINMLMECSIICKTAATFMIMESQHSKELCTLCEKICRQCAKECDMFKEEHCKICSETCEECAEECKAMA